LHSRDVIVIDDSDDGCEDDLAAVHVRSRPSRSPRPTVDDSNYSDGSEEADGEPKDNIVGGKG
jgi:hypothetical protein